MEIERKDDGNSGEFIAKKDSKKAGFMSFTWSGKDKFIIDHTEVDPEFEGQGIGKQLVHAAVDYARKNNLKIIPKCSYAKSVLEKDEKLHDVLD